MKIFNLWCIAAALVMNLTSLPIVASSLEDKIAGLYLSTEPYISSIINSTRQNVNEQTLMFHPDGTMTRNDASAYNKWGEHGEEAGLGLFFSQPFTGVWEIVHEKDDGVIVHAAIFEYSPATEYPPSESGIPPFFSPNSGASILRRCWAYKFHDLKNGKFQKCVGLKASTVAIFPNQDPLSTDIPQGAVQPGSAVGPLPVFSRVKVRKAWFKGFHSD